jgi:hypothetical protein
MALNRSSSEEEMLVLGAVYFLQAGIDMNKNSCEMDYEYSPEIEAELVFFLRIMNSLG